MAKKAKEEVEEQEAVEEPVAPALNEREMNKLVRIRNQGAPFVCDLTAYGYGARWPTNAVYAIPLKEYLQLVKQGFNGTHV